MSKGKCQSIIVIGFGLIVLSGIVLYYALSSPRVSVNEAETSSTGIIVYNDAQYTPIQIGNQSEYYIEGLNSNEVYYFTITAIGGEGGNIESGFSKEVYVRPVH